MKIELFVGIGLVFQICFLLTQVYVLCCISSLEKDIDYIKKVSTLPRRKRVTENIAEIIPVKKIKPKVNDNETLYYREKNEQ